MNQSALFAPTLSPGSFAIGEMNSVTRIEKFLEKPLIGEVGR